MTTYAIGDVQGCYEALRRLLDRLCYDPAHDQLWFAGDLVNRGPGSLSTLRFVKSLGPSALTVLGNHDLHLLARAHGGRAGKQDTLDEVLSAPDCDALLDWLRQQPLMHEANGWTLLHAGLPPQWTLADARRAARSLEKTLRGPKLARFLADLYGDEPRVWTPALRGCKRQRYIVNAFTRMRYCSDDGSLDFKHKSRPGQQPSGLQPWFSVADRQVPESEIIFGHWSTLGQVHWPQYRVWGLDTGAVWGGQLTALNLETRQLTQVECPEFRRPGYSGD